jgi:hypothetical protein
MKITVESTTQIVEINGVPCRLWEGHTERGIAIHCFITRVAVEDTLDTSQFEQELAEQRPPAAKLSHAYPARMLL